MSRKSSATGGRSWHLWKSVQHKAFGFSSNFFCACFSLLHSTLLEGASARGCCSVLRKEKRKQKRNQEQFFLCAGKDTRATTCHPNIDVFSFFSIGPPGHLTCVRQHDPSRPGAGLIFLSFRETGLDSEPLRRASRSMCSCACS